MSPVRAIFVPGDPPRAGRLALWPPPADRAEGDGEPGQIDIVAANVRGGGVRRTTVTALLVPIARGIEMLSAPDPPDGGASATDPQGGDAGGDATLRSWRAAARTGLQLIARGRLLPSASPDGWDAWRVGPLDPADLNHLHALAAAFPAAAHALPVPGSRPLRIRSAESLIRALWDAMADALVRTPAAALVAGHDAYAAVAPTNVDGIRDWLMTADRSLDAKARPGLRLELPDGPDGEFCATLQLQSTSDHSLVVDAADLWDAPTAVLARMGEDADTDLLLALRRGARTWPPLGRLLEVARPQRLILDDTETSDLLGDAAAGLAAAGIDVLWPAVFAADDLTLRAVIRSTPSPAAVTGTGLGLPTLLKFDWQAALGGEDLTEQELADLAEAKRPLVRVRGRWVTVDPTVVQRLRRRPPRQLSVTEALAAALAGEIQVEGDPVTFRAEGALADLVERLRESAEREVAPPAGLVATLRPYQLRGLGWLTEMATLGVGGCLADDMGLGKTVQVIALHLVRPHPGPTLVVCPTSLLGNWEREIHRFAPGVPVRRFHGGDRHLGALAPDEIVLATYGVVRRDHAELAAPDWGLVVADEAQHAKNPLSGTARALRALHGGARIALTGTPVENRLSELWSILDWTTPGLLGPLDAFRRQVAVPVERYHDPEATERLTRVVRPFLLRRRKSDPLIAPELPPKTETDLVVPMTTEQVTLYEAVVRETMAEIAASAGIQRRGLVLKLLTALKQVCNHPAQFLRQPGPLLGRSGKLAALDELVDVITAEGESVLVFTQYVRMASLLAAHLTSRGVASMTLEGKVPARQREAMVDRFQAGEVPVFILSLRAGGTGLNLTRATHVVHYDRWWNPAVEDQASDRAHRIGQDRPVQVHRLITEGTLEDRIGSVLATKRDLADRVVGAGEAWISELSDDELASLVALGRGT